VELRTELVFNTKRQWQYLLQRDPHGVKQTASVHPAPAQLLVPHVSPTAHGSSGYGSQTCTERCLIFTEGDGPLRIRRAARSGKP